MKKKWLLVGIVLILSLVVYVTYATSGLTILIYGKKMTSDISAKLENGTILVPLCVIAENLNQKIQWDPKTKTVTIEKKVIYLLSKIVKQLRKVQLKKAIPL